MYTFNLHTFLFIYYSYNLFVSESWSSGVGDLDAADLTLATKQLQNANAHTDTLPDPTTSYDYLANNTSLSPARSHVSKARSVISSSSEEDSSLSDTLVNPTPVPPKPKHNKELNSKGKRKKVPTSNSSESSTEENTQRVKHRKRKHKKSKLSKTHLQRNNIQSDRPVLDKTFVIPKIHHTQATNESSKDHHFYINYYEQLLESEEISSDSTLLHIRNKCGLEKAEAIKMLNTVFPHLGGDDEFSQPHNFAISLKQFTAMEIERKEKSQKSVKASPAMLDANVEKVIRSRRYKEEYDDLQTIHHSRLFQRLSVTGGNSLFIEDSKRHVDRTPISQYDLTDVMGASHVTTRGWINIHRPDAPDITIKDYFSRNFQSDSQVNIFSHN